MRQTPGSRLVHEKREFDDVAVVTRPETDRSEDMTGSLSMCSCICECWVDRRYSVSNCVKLHFADAGQAGTTHG